MELQKIIYTVEDGIAVIQMNYMKNLNAVDDQMADEMLYVLDAADQDPAVKVVILKGGDKAFSAGGDIGYFYNVIQGGGEMDPCLIVFHKGRLQNRTEGSHMYRPAFLAVGGFKGFFCKLVCKTQFFHIAISFVFIYTLL